ncbi:MAG: NYN domain-containing protein [Anaerolineae bacterium]|nr:NYN domain-containing protein [Anaerolineae bacterium]
MPYLIDGHNLIGRIPDLSLDDPHDEAKLVDRLRSYMARKRKRCTVVFDKGLPGGPSRNLSTHNVRVVFAHGGTTADAIIMERIRETRDPHSQVIVSADQEIVHAAHRRHMQVIAPAAFASDLAESPMPDDDDPNPHLTPAEIDDWLRLFGIEPDSGEDS